MINVKYNNYYSLKHLKLNKMSRHSVNKSEDAGSLMASEGESLFEETRKNNTTEEAYDSRRVHYDSKEDMTDEQKTEEIL